MKRLVVVLTVVALISVSASAKKLPAVKAAPVPVNLKTEIVNNIDYPEFAEEQGLEGDVWMKVTVDANNQVQVVDMSATNQALGKYVKKELKELYVENSGVENGQVYFLKLKFDLLSK
jgi:DNA-binding transcriptional regulator WhiA